MFRTVTAAAAGLLHAEQRQQATAHSTADLNTADTVGLQAGGREAPGAAETGADRREERRAELGYAEAANVRSATPAADAAVDQIAAVRQAGALRRVMQATDDLTRTSIDLIG